MSSRAERIRKRSKEIEQESKKIKQGMDKTKSEETETSSPEIDNLNIINEAKNMIAGLQISNIDTAIATSMARHMEQWPGKILETFVTKCNLLIDSAIKKTYVKIARVEDTLSVHKKRLNALEEIAEDYDQSKRNCNIIVRGRKPCTDAKQSVINMLTTGLGIHITERDIKFSIKLTLKNEKDSTESKKVALFDPKP